MKDTSKRPREQHLSFDGVKRCMTVAFVLQPNREHRRWVPSLKRFLFGGELGMMAGRIVRTWQPVVGCIIGSDVMCGACIIDETNVWRIGDAVPCRTCGIGGMWAAYIAYLCRLKYAVEGRRRGRDSRLVSGGREGLYLVW